VTHITVGEHLSAMVNEQPQSWMVELGLILQELGNTDNALAASQTYDLARQPKAALALKELITGYNTIKQELLGGDLTQNQKQTILIALRQISKNLESLSLSSELESSKGVNHG